MILKFTVHAPVQGKARHRSGMGRQYTPAKTVAYERAIKAEAKDAMRRKGVAPLEGPLRLTVVARFSPPASASKRKRAAMLAGELRPTKKPDLSNHLKAIEDAMNGVVFADDSAIVELVSSKVYAASEGSDVTLEELYPALGDSAEDAARA